MFLFLVLMMDPQIGKISFVIMKTLIRLEKRPLCHIFPRHVQKIVHCKIRALAR